MQDHLQPTGVSPAEDAPTRPDATVASPPGLGDGRPRQFLPGTLFGKRYRIVELLGRGGMGEVYRADDLQLGQAVALKFLPSDLTDHPEALARLRHEVRVARQIAHPNVCRVYDIGEEEGQSFLSMEYIDGEDLRSVLRRLGRPTGVKSLEIARQMCAGLAAAHAAGVLHRDLKPANIMIDGRGRVRITDFGLARFAHESSRTGWVGTPAYLAPELFAGAEASTFTDIYALGAVLYELFTGRAAFRVDSMADLRGLQRAAPPPTPSSLVDDVDPAVERVVMSCLEVDAHQRPASVLAVAATLPGGDPVAAALAAGETPTPEMVAAAGGDGALRPAVASACLAGVIGGLLAIGALSERVTLHRLAPPAKPGVVVADRARDILERLGHDAPSVDRAYGWETYDGYLSHLSRTDSSPDRWDRLREQRPPVYWLWYRESPVSLIPRGTSNKIEFRDPPLDVPGMAGVKLDHEGRLAVLVAVPPQIDPEPSPAEPLDYSVLFEAAGLEPTDFEAIPPEWNPGIYADARAAWTGHYPGQPDWPLRVEAATYRGKPVYFQVIESFDEPRERWHVDDRSRADRLAGGMSVLVTLVALVVPGVLARRNLRRGSGDRTGAMRLGIAVWLLALAHWLLFADHSAVISAELNSFIFNLGMAVLLGVWTGLAYLGLEPLVRRQWPTTMISWTRLLMGRILDRRVGRDVLLGALAGIAAILITHVEWLLPAWFGAAPRIPYPAADDAFLGGTRALSFAVDPGYLIGPLVILLLLAVLRAVLRKPWLAVAGTLTVLVLVDGHWRGDDMQGLALASAVAQVLVFHSLFLFVLLRFGLLAVVMGFYFLELLTSVPVTLDFAAWYGGTSLGVLLLLTAIAAIAMRTSMVPARSDVSGREAVF